ncbi:MAG TPA: serine/threonine-protein kinase PknK, partial [Anaerolineales bacterium]|nr:serine/threonine-protein kinase PknK [Anaerolineales bacterium]
MTELAGYTLKEKLHEGRSTLVHRAARKPDGAPVVLKMLKDSGFSSETFARFKREYEMTASLDTSAIGGEVIPGVIGAYAFETVNDLPAIVLEDFGGESLDIHPRVWSLDDFFNLSMQIVDTLGQVHTRHIMHKNINPSNIVYNPESGEAKLIDFGLSTLLPRETIAQVNVNVLEGTLAYLSPEQTGRINRAVDYRTDFYSLGVTFYQLLTGRLPFEETDPLALLHSHLAKQPIPPHEIAPVIPNAVSNIVMKLLAKNAEDRYQSAYGLKADLNECRRQWRSDQIIRDFPLGQKDVSDRFQISQALFGRENEVRQLLSAFERAKNGSCEIVLISGEVGMGKSSLVNELQIHVVGQNGSFVGGKYLQSQSPTPYSALIEALRALVQQLLSESEETLAAVGGKIQLAIGVNGQVIVDMIPEAARVLGAQPPLQPLTAEEEQNRFNFTLQNFIESFLNADHPLVLFLDDLQWADAASSSFLQRFAGSPDLHHILIIGSLRANEITLDHPLNGSLRQFRESGNPVSRIELKPLQFDDVQHMIAHSLNCPAEESSALAELTLAKTGGNPFFINEFLRGIYNDGLLRFDIGSGGWVWDLPRIQTRPSTENVVEVMSDKIKDLPDETRWMLDFAACIGYEFDLSTLAALSHRTRPETASALWHSLASGLIFPLTQNYIFAEQADSDSEVRYSFSHAGIRQGIYYAIPESEKQSIHWQIGQLLLETIPEEQREGRIFELVNHLNLSSNRIQTNEQRIQIAGLNLLASQKTYYSAAHEASHQYSTAGIKRLQELESQGINIWQHHYSLAFDLFFRAASASYLTRRYEEMESFSGIAITNAASVFEQATVYEMKLYASISKDDRAEGLKMGLKALDLLGLKYPKKAGIVHVLVKLIQTQLNLRGKSDDDILNLPETQDPRVIAIGRVIRGFFTILYTNAPELAPIVFMDLVILSLKHGNFNMSPFGYVCFGFILNAALGDIAGGDRFGKLAMRLVEKLNTPQARAIAYFFHATVLQHWTEPLRNTMPTLEEGAAAALSVGDFSNASNMLLIRDYHGYVSGCELDQLDREMTSNGAIIHQFQQTSIANYHNLYHQAALNMMGRGNHPLLFKGPLSNAEDMLPQHIAANERSIVMNYYIHPMIFHYLWEDYNTALEFNQKTEPYLDG